MLYKTEVTYFIILVEIHILCFLHHYSIFLSTNYHVLKYAFKMEALRLCKNSLCMLITGRECINV